MGILTKEGYNYMDALLIVPGPEGEDPAIIACDADMPTEKMVKYVRCAFKNLVKAQNMENPDVPA